MINLIVFDFDWSLVNENSDTWIIEMIPSMSQHMDHVRSTCPDVYGEGCWTNLMSYMIRKMMTEYFISKDDLCQRLHAIPIMEEIFSILEYGRMFNAKFIILSDANSFFINEILAFHHISEYFSMIVTNPAYFDSNEILNILPFQSIECNHNCPHCPKNLCKGKELSKIISQLEEEGQMLRIIYVGDGSGDYCPTLRLNAKDTVCCRKNWSLHKKLSMNSDMNKANILPWSDGKELFDAFKTHFNQNDEL